MSKTIEKEERLMLSKEQYETLIASYPGAHFIHITNLYFDNKELSFTHQHHVLRIRYIQEYPDVEFTLKIKGNNGDTEITQNLKEEEIQDFLCHHHFPEGEIKIFLLANHFDIESISNIANLSTVRYERKEEDTLVVIDENHYGDMTDYDLEVESSSMKRSREKILSLAEKYHLTYQKAYLSKSRRAFLYFKVI